MRDAQGRFTRVGQLVILACATWALFAAVICWWAFDRRAPFDIIQYVEPPPAKPGQLLRFNFPVRRQLERECSVRFTRHIIDSSGVRSDYEANHFMNADSLRAMDRVMGPYVRNVITLPSSLAEGRAVLVTNVQYQCNPLHAWWPIRVTLYYPFEVLPEKGG
jgi:hypothetical protein